MQVFKKFLALILFAVIFIFASCPVFAYDTSNLSPLYLEWLNHSADVDYNNPIIPSPADWSRLPYYSDSESTRSKGLVRIKADNLPVKYDLRDYNRVTPVKDQKSYGTCWVFASISSLESSYKTLYPDEDIDFSELFTAYFVRKYPEMNVYFDGDEGYILYNGGNVDMVVGLISKRGIVNESVLPYPKPLPNKPVTEYETAGVRLKAAFMLHNDGKIDDYVKSTIKTFIKKYGAVYTAYQDNKSYYINEKQENSAYYYNSQYYNHAVSIVGWDDNFPRETFPESMRPQNNGAWLIKNSWGIYYWHNKGYFWMSYEQPIYESSVLVAEKAPQDLKHYDYDGGMIDYNTGIKWSASVFRAESDETLKYAGFYTIQGGTNYNIYVYDLGTALPASPVNGTLIASLKGFKEYRGYHTEEFTENVPVLKDHYFSVVVNCDTGTASDSRLLPARMKNIYSLLKTAKNGQPSTQEWMAKHVLRLSQFRA